MPESNLPIMEVMDGAFLEEAYSVFYRLHYTSRMSLREAFNKGAKHYHDAMVGAAKAMESDK